MEHEEGVSVSRAMMYAMLSRLVSNYEEQLALLRKDNKILRAQVLISTKEGLPSDYEEEDDSESNDDDNVNMQTSQKRKLSSSEEEKTMTTAHRTTTQQTLKKRSLSKPSRRKVSGKRRSPPLCRQPP